MYKLTLRCFNLKCVDYSEVGWWFCNEENLKLYLPSSISFDFDILFIVMLCLCCIPNPYWAIGSRCVFLPADI